MYVETIAGSLEVILGYFVIVPLIVKLVSSVIAVAVIWVLSSQTETPNFKVPGLQSGYDELSSKNKNLFRRKFIRLG